MRRRRRRRRSRRRSRRRHEVPKPAPKKPRNTDAHDNEPHKSRVLQLIQSSLKTWWSQLNRCCSYKSDTTSLCRRLTFLLSSFVSGRRTTFPKTRGFVFKNVWVELGVSSLRLSFESSWRSFMATLLTTAFVVRDSVEEMFLRSVVALNSMVLHYYANLVPANVVL